MMPVPNMAGGAIYSVFNSYTYIYDTIFTRCTSKTVTGQARGGAVLLTVSMVGAFVGCTFTACTATSAEGPAYGGAVMHYLSDTLFSGCTFTDCRVASAKLNACPSAC